MIESNPGGANRRGFHFRRARASGFPLALVVAILIYAGFRAAVLHTAFDSVCIPAFELPVMGNLARLVCGPESGAPLSIYYDNCGGQVLTGLVAAPLYALLGPSYLTLKLVPAAMGIAILVLLWRTLALHYDRRAADLFALLFALGPPTLAKYSLLAKGNHFEGLFFQVLLLCSFVAMHARGPSALGLIRTAGCAGFALFAYFGSVVLVAALAGLHLVLRGRRIASDLGPAFGGFLLGIAPLLYFELEAPTRPSAFLLTKTRAVTEGYGARFEKLLSEILPRASAFEDLGPIPGRFADALFLALFVLAWIVCALEVALRWARGRASPTPAGAPGGARERTSFETLRELPFLLFLPLFALTVSAGSFEFKPYAPPVEVGRYRYLVPHLAFALVLIALAAARLWRAQGRSARLLGALLALSALTSGAFTLPIAELGARETGLGVRYPGHHFLQYSNVVLRDRWRAESGEFVWDVGRVEEQLAGLSPEQRNEAWIGIGNFAAWAHRLGAARAGERTRRTLSLGGLVEQYPSSARIAIARGAGCHLRRVWGREGEQEEFARQLDALRIEDHPLLPWLIEGLCIDERFPLARVGDDQARESAAFEPLVPRGLRFALRRGQGTQVGRAAARGIPSDLRRAHELAASMPPEDRADFWFGLGFGLAEGAPGPQGLDRLLQLVPEPGLELALAGFGASRRAAGLASAVPVGSTLGDSELAAVRGGYDWPGFPASPRL